MYKLIKILGGRINHGESRTVTVAPLTAKIKEGTPVLIREGEVTVISGSMGLPVTHIVDFEAEKGASRIKVTDLLPGMVFSTVMLGESSEYFIGGEYVVSPDGLLSDPVAKAHTGAVVYDIPERLEGGEILVTFPAN